MKKPLIIALAALFLFGCVGGSLNNADSQKPMGEKSLNSEISLSVVATLFPQYDFAKSIGKDKVRVSMLLPPGMESHSFEPTPSDIINVNNSDVFIYTGDYMEAWAATIIDGITEDTVVLDCTERIQLEKDHEHEEHEHEEDHENESYDPHVWTDPNYALLMAKNIRDTFIKLNPENKDYYEANFKELEAKLLYLDKELEEVTENALREKMVFGGRFPFYYFTERYDLEHIAVFDSCSTEGEASAAKIAEIIDTINQEKIPVIYYEELTVPKAATVIASETGVEILPFYSFHNLSKDDFESGITYFELMERNIENLKKGLM